MMQVFVVGLGGFIGSCCRFLLTKLFNQVAPNFPYGTLCSNLLAGLLIGIIIGFERQTGALSAITKLLLTTGFLGGLSTFSTFSMETVQLFEKGKVWTGVGNIACNLGFSLLFVVIGLQMMSLLRPHG